MKSERAQVAEYVSTQLLPRALLLTRLLAKEVGGGLSITEAGLLRSLGDGPLRITALAESEGLAQPTTTLLVKRLEQQGLVTRERQDHDRRVVLVRLTDEGAAAIADYRARVLAALRGHLDQLSEGQLETLAAGTDALQELIDLLLGFAVVA
jgi:DNA-binding MarR family transcriptional regulator